MTSVKLNIALIDDHQMLSQSLANLLSNYEFINDVKTFATANEFLTTLGKESPDVVITDIVMPGISGIELLILLKEKNIPAKVVILSSVTEIQTIRYALNKGAAGYLSKDVSSEELAEALRVIDIDEPYIGESLRKSLLRRTLNEDRFIYNLSPREKEVLQYVCSGKTIKETAFEMSLSINTVQTYYKTILKKFNLNRTADLIVFAIQNGLYNPTTGNC